MEGHNTEKQTGWPLPPNRTPVFATLGIDLRIPQPILQNYGQHVPLMLRAITMECTSTPPPKHRWVSIACPLRLTTPDCTHFYPNTPRIKTPIR